MPNYVQKGCTCSRMGCVCSKSLFLDLFRIHHRLSHLAIRASLSGRYRKWQISPATRDITNAIISNNLHSLKSTLAESHSRFLALAITHNSHLTIPHLISLGGSAHPDTAMTALLAPSTFPALVTLITKCNYDVNINLDRLGNIFDPQY